MNDEKILAMFAQLLQGQTQIRGELGEVKEKLGVVENEILQLTTKVENEIADKIRGLFDAREVQTNINERIINSLDGIEAKLHSVQVDAFRTLKSTRQNKQGEGCKTFAHFFCFTIRKNVTRFFYVELARLRGYHLGSKLIRWEGNLLNDEKILKCSPN